MRMKKTVINTLVRMWRASRTIKESRSGITPEGCSARENNVLIIAVFNKRTATTVSCTYDLQV